MGVQATESFEDIYRQLEETVRRLDEGGLTLDESIALYEEGMTLARRCQTLLEHAELRVSQLRDLLAVAQGPDDAEDDTFDENGE
jgi:exodeoxyribonuclease VII small subunit